MFYTQEQIDRANQAYNFCYRGGGDRLFVFEAPIDLLSFLCLFKRAWQEQSYLSLGGVGEKAMLRFLAARTLKPCISALTATKREATLAAALPSLRRRASPLPFALTRKQAFHG